MEQAYRLERHAVQYGLTVRVSKSEFRDFKESRTTHVIAPENIFKRKQRPLLTEEQQEWVHWQYFLADMVEIQESGQELIFFADMLIKDHPEGYSTTAIVFFRPPLESPPRELMSALANQFLTPSVITDAQVLHHIKDMERNIRFHPENIIKLDDKRPVEAGDLLYVLMENELQTIENRPPTRNIVGMNPDCPEDLYSAILGQGIGETVIIGWDLDGTGKRVRVKLTIECRIKPKDFTERDFLDIEGCDSMEELRVKVRQRLESGTTVEFQQQFDKVLFQNSRLGPVPAPMVYDRAEGYVEALLASSTEQEVFRQLQVNTRPQAVEVSCPAVVFEMRRQLLALIVCEELGITPSDEEMGMYLDRNELPETWDTRWVARAEVAYTKALRYYRSRGADYELLRHTPDASCIR